MHRPDAIVERQLLKVGNRGVEGVVEKVDFEPHIKLYLRRIERFKPMKLIEIVGQPLPVHVAVVGHREGGVRRYAVRGKALGNGLLDKVSHGGVPVTKLTMRMIIGQQIHIIFLKIHGPTASV